MRRGEIWRYEPVVARSSQPALRLIVSADLVTADASQPDVLAIQVVDADPGTLMAARIREHGWARALTIEPVPRSRLIEHLGTANAEEMEQVSNALRAVQDL